MKNYNEILQPYVQKGNLVKRAMKMLKADTNAKDEKERTIMSKIMQIFSLELFLNPAKFHQKVFN